MPLLGKADGRGNLIVVAAVLVCGLWLGGCESSKSAPPPSVPEVATVTVQPEQVVLTTELPGRTSAYSMAEIRPQVGGIIQKRLFEEGADIRDGQALYEIDPAPLQAAYDNAAANLAAARRAVARAQAALEASHTGVLRQRAIVENARVNRKRFEEYGIREFMEAPDVEVLHFVRSYEGKDLLTEDIRKELSSIPPDDLIAHGFELAVRVK